MTTREAFEAFISAPPFEMPIERFDDRSAWPGSYTEIEVDLAWQAWQAATDAALERAADEVSIVDSKTWFGNQLAFGIACRKAIRALKEQQ